VTCLPRAAPLRPAEDDGQTVAIAYVGGIWEVATLQQARTPPNSSQLSRTNLLDQAIRQNGCYSESSDRFWEQEAAGSNAAIPTKLSAQVRGTSCR
jgi:hypothetical protein